MTINASRLEVNFRRLLGQCNKLLSDGDAVDDWRIETYVSSLESMLSNLKQNPSPPNNEVLAEYTRQVEFLKGIIQADKLPTASEKAIASQLIATGPPTGNQKLTKEIHLKTTGKYVKEMRRELLGTDGIRRRDKASNDGPDDDYDAILKYHQNMQEKIAEEMVSFARNLKENSRLAGSIIRKDTEMIEKSGKLADQNYDRLKVESGRLEQHTQRACNWWIWIMLAFVCFIFIWMVLFMKIFPKKT